MELREAIAARRSVRAFLDRPVAEAVLVDLARKAARAATGGNIQPWHIDIVHGAPLAALKRVMADKIARGETETPGYDIYPRALASLYKQRVFAIGEALYGHLGIPREDKTARRRWFARNFQFFGAPAAYFCTIDRGMGPPQWADLGMYLQTLMLLAVDAGLATCPQECWAMYAGTVEAFLDTPSDRMLFCGIAIGYEDSGDPANRMRSERAADGEWLRVRS